MSSFASLWDKKLKLRSVFYNLQLVSSKKYSEESTQKEREKIKREREKEGDEDEN